ncbi:MAG: hypothetical protein Q4C04_00305 [Clostridia bacterium]|nr:hypothetical protein [Clostridia bacterium]
MLSSCSSNLPFYRLKNSWLRHRRLASGSRTKLLMRRRFLNRAVCA